MRGPPLSVHYPYTKGLVNYVQAAIKNVTTPLAMPTGLEGENGFQPSLEKCASPSCSHVSGGVSSFLRLAAPCSTV